MRENLLTPFPSNSDAEKGVLGAFLINPTLFNRYGNQIEANDFFQREHRIIFSSMARLSEKHTQFDSVLLHEALLAEGNLRDAGGSDYLITLQENIAVLGFVDQYIALIKEKSSLRKIISCASELISVCASQKNDSVGTVIDKAEQMLFTIACRRVSHTFFSLEHLLKGAFESLIKNVQATNTQKGITGVPSGYIALDRMTGGFQRGDFIVIAARPSMGKTALALSIAHRAAQYGCSVGIVSLEMSAEQIVFRLLSLDTRIKLLSLRCGMLQGEEWSRLTESAAKLSLTKIFIDDVPLQTILEVRTKARRLVMEHQISFLIVDYLQLLTTERKQESRQQEVSEVSRFLKSLARELGIPIIALSQLSRGVESRADRRPMLSDLRDSGAIEQDADLILFLYRDVVYDQTTDTPYGAELIIGKHRNGPTGTVMLQFLSECALFTDGVEELG